MALHLYNTLTRQKAPFEPIHGKKVGVYVCGVTVWDSTHLGHGRAATIFDVLVRYLRHRGYDVTYAKNYTDVDDKIINRANEEGVSWQVIAERFIQEYANEMVALGNLPPDLEPKASEHIPQMIAFIDSLIKNKKAYAMHGNVFYSVRAFSGYGKLSGKKIEELESGARVEVDDAKRDPLDFALWKAVKPGEPSWESPWGPGRPGWHIECSAMSMHHLGQPFDIHGGGRDLIFPHHENEIAQSEGLGCGEFVRVWLHNGQLTTHKEKMSKSLGNYFRTCEALKKYNAEGLRYFLLSAHYRSPLDFNEKALADAQEALCRMYDTSERLGKAEAGSFPSAPPKEMNKGERALVQRLQTFREKVDAAMDDDLNTPRVFGLVFETVRELNKYLNADPQGPTRQWIQMAWYQHRQFLCAILGIGGCAPVEFRQRCAALAMAHQGIDPSEVERLIAERAAARESKDFAKADVIRDQLNVMGVIFKDRPDGTTEWHVK